MVLALKEKECGGRAVSFSKKPQFCRGSAPRAYPPHQRFNRVSGIGALLGGIASTKNETALSVGGS
jgi:hypothetical protein